MDGAGEWAVGIHRQVVGFWGQAVKIRRFREGVAKLPGLQETTVEP